MKYLRYLAAIVLLSAVAFRAEAKLGSVIINLTAVQQSLYAQGAFRTNITATTTNVTIVQKYTTTNTVINNAKILKMLANSFNTNFPADAVLKIDENRNVVVVVGTNVILNAKTVVRIGFFGSPNLDAGSVTVSQTMSPTATNLTERGTFTDTAIDNFTYDDSALTPADGKTTNFKLEGFRTERVVLAYTEVNAITNAAGALILTLPCAGHGTVSAKNAVIKGVVSASAFITDF